MTVHNLMVHKPSKIDISNQLTEPEGGTNKLRLDVNSNSEITAGNGDSLSAWVRARDDAIVDMIDVDFIPDDTDFLREEQLAWLMMMGIREDQIRKGRDEISENKYRAEQAKRKALNRSRRYTYPSESSTEAYWRTLRKEFSNPFDVSDDEGYTDRSCDLWQRTDISRGQVIWKPRPENWHGNAQIAVRAKKPKLAKLATLMAMLVEQKSEQ